MTGRSLAIAFHSLPSYLQDLLRHQIDSLGFMSLEFCHCVERDRWRKVGWGVLPLWDLIQQNRLADCQPHVQQSPPVDICSDSYSHNREPSDMNDLGDSCIAIFPDHRGGLLTFRFSLNFEQNGCPRDLVTYKSHCTCCKSSECYRCVERGC